jgi:alpha-beta hydrolase superfamily lysophospholipase
VKVYDGWFHELHNEPEKETVFDDIVVWLKEHG